MIRDHLVRAIEDVCEIKLWHYGAPSERFHHAEGPKIHLGHVYLIDHPENGGEPLINTFGIKICTDMLEGFVKYVGVWAEFAEGRTPTNSIEIDADADLNAIVNWVVEQLDNANFVPPVEELRAA